eukprot:9493447-Pyramimonas_sp.AAC.1
MSMLTWCGPHRGAADDDLGLFYLEVRLGAPQDGEGARLAQHAAGGGHGRALQVADGQHVLAPRARLPTALRRKTYTREKEKCFKKQRDGRAVGSTRWSPPEAGAWSGQAAWLGGFLLLGLGLLPETHG